jgi:diguanylate cyclase
VNTHDHHTLAPRPSAPRVDPLMPRTLSDEEFALFAAAGQRQQLQAGQVLFERGQAGQSMFVVDTGLLRLEFGDGLADRVIGPMEYCGELAVFIGQHARMASAVAEEPTSVYVIDQAGFERLLASEPGLLARFMRRSFAYLVASETQLILGLRRRNEDLMQTLDSLRQTRTELSIAQQLVRTDELTGLANRRGLYRYVQDLERQPIAESRLALLLIDIDEFKRVNDRNGHLAGDSALRAVAEEVRRAAGPMDLPARLGGDEFALVCRVADAGELANRAVQLVSGVRALRLPSVRELVRVSVGACFCPSGEDWSAWYSRADAQLYQAKGEGGDRWRLGG